MGEVSSKWSDRGSWILRGQEGQGAQLGEGGYVYLEGLEGPAGDW